MAYKAWIIGLLSLFYSAAVLSSDDLDALLGTTSEAPAESEQAEAAPPAESTAEPAPAASTTSRARPRVIEEIIVTAQKTEQTLQEVPVAVSVVDGAALRNAGVFGPEGIEDMVPNVELDADQQAPTIGIRGFSTDSYNVGLEPSVGITVDEIAIGRSEFIPDGLFDINRVEVLRGPQGTLFGKNTIAGVLIFATNPVAADAGVDLSYTSGEFDTDRIEGSVNLPFGEQAGVRGSFVDWHKGGDVENSFLHRRELETDQQAARLKFDMDLGERARLRLGGQSSEIDTTYSGWQLYAMDPEALGYVRSKDPDSEDDPFDAHTSFDKPGFVTRDTEVYHAIVDYNFSDNHEFSLIAGHANLFNDVRFDLDVSAADLILINADFNYDQDSLEFRFVGNGDAPFDTRMEYIAGLFSFDSKMDIVVDVALGEDIGDFQFTPAGIEALGLAPDEVTGQVSPLNDLLASLPFPSQDLGDGVNQVFDQTSESVAAFGQVTWFFADKWSTVLGLRLAKEEKKANLMNQSRGPGIVAQIIEAENFSQPLQRKERDVSPKVGFSYEYSEDISSYLSWTRGFKSGGFNAISFQNRHLNFEPEQGDNYEFGIKSKLLDGTLGLNLTVYHTDVTNMQVVNFNGVAFEVFNAAEARLRGVEADLRWLTPWQWLTINAALAVAEAEYTSYPDAPAPASSEEEEQDLSGRTLPKAPEITASLSPQISLPLFNNMGLNLGFNLSHRGDQFLELDLDPRSKQKAHTVLDAYINFGPEDGLWNLTLRGENLTNEEVLNFVGDHSIYANSYISAQIPLKRVSLTLNANW